MPCCSVCKNAVFPKVGVDLGEKTFDIFFFVFLARAGVWLLFNGLLALLFYVIREFDKFLHRG